MVDFTKLPEPLQLKDPRELIPFGWAPGGYICKCNTCQTHHQGSDKHSARCQPCALAKQKAFQEAKAEEPVQLEYQPDTIIMAKPYRLLFNDKGQHIGYLWDPD